MNLIISLPEENSDFLDGNAHDHGIESLSAAVHGQSRLPRASQPGSACAGRWQGWTQAGGAQPGNAAARDRLAER
jgi:hypothetical protein